MPARGAADVSYWHRVRSGHATSGVRKTVSRPPLGNADGFGDPSFALSLLSRPNPRERNIWANSFRRELAVFARHKLTRALCKGVAHPWGRAGGHTGMNCALSTGRPANARRYASQAQTWPEQVGNTWRPSREAPGKPRRAAVGVDLRLAGGTSPQYAPPGLPILADQGGRVPASQELTAAFSMTAAASSVNWLESAGC